MTDNDVAVDGERQNQQLAEVLRQEEEHVEHLADYRQVVQVHVHVELEGVERVDDQEHDAVDGQRGDVDRRRVVPAHSTLEPDHCRQSVADQADQQPHDDDDKVEPDRVRGEVQVQQRAWVPVIHRHLADGRHRIRSHLVHRGACNRRHRRHGFLSHNWQI